MSPGFRGHGRGGGGRGGSSRGGGFSRGRSGGGRGRGTPRGRGRGRGGGGIKSHDNNPRDRLRLDPTEDFSSDSEAEPQDPSGDESVVSEISVDSEPEEAAILKPYSVLIQSLASSKKSVNEDQRKAKRRRIEHYEAENFNENVEWVVEKEEAGEEAEAQEGEEEGEEEVEEVEEVEEESSSDPFETHFANPTAEYLRNITAVERNEWENKKYSHPGVGGKILFSAPTGSAVQPARKIDGLKDIKLKKRLEVIFSELNGGFTPVQEALAPCMFSHQDILFNSRTLANAEELRRLVCVHALNHIFKTRDKILKNNARLSRGGPEAESLELRDQGFTRPKVLFILPTRNACAEVLETLISLVQPEQQENKKRFTESYVLPEDQERIGDNKPADFRALFKGNHDDMFRLGLKFTRKTVKLFSQFYNSDIIFASPLGLRMIIGDESDKKRDYDFLSSMEVVVVDQADALLMQNWEHVDHVFKHLNLIPKDAHGCDFGRVRNWYLDSHAKFLRQTIVMSQFVTPELNALFTNHMRNIAGRVKTQEECVGSMMDLGLQVRQTFTRFDSSTPSNDPTIRFHYFTTTLLPSLLRSASSGGTLIFIPSYFDFVRLRNHLETLDVSFGAISEETSVPAVARARSHFLTGRHSVLLYTGRAHHFRRYTIKGATRVVFYALPDNPVFYKEVAGGFLLSTVADGKLDAGECGVRVLFSRWDAMKVERVVGTKRVRVMCTDVGDTFEFV